MDPLDVIKAKRVHLARFANQQGAAGEVRALDDMSNWVSRPRGKGLKVLLAALLEIGIQIKASSFDAIELPQAQNIDFMNVDQVRELLPHMIFIEIKTANQARVKPDFSGFFFALTESEIAAADALGSRHRVALRNNLTGETYMTSVPEIISRAKSSSWQLSVQL
ncbi:hypothetical protein HNQ93_003786 [Hymenobacter luteus]|uniref:DUF3883 domain-containing protein n=2 Tax=Hymenobacter TaxID=89966 RepID=A0A7W9T3N1_9BACT|nr:MULTISPECIES: hypothetical protein [Hymenobacter]MBB4603131.1 hypothetical protein [Hymenobacter latericoloratus]MBB6060910.1 hypothetical protein [Hymenobacter luteus]